MDDEKIEKFLKYGVSAQKAVDKIIDKARKRVTGKTDCAYDGYRQTFTDGRCVFCGDTRREAEKAVRVWERENPHLCPKLDQRRRDI